MYFSSVFALGLLLLASTPARAQLLSPGPLSRAHRELEGDGKCQSCHASGSQVVETKCNECHKDVGAERSKSFGLHGKAFKGKPCSSCHVEHLGANVSLIRWPGTDPKKFDHSQTGFLLKDGHADVQCAECHDKKNSRGAPTYLGNDKKCGSCHEEPHKGRFGDKCTNCHNERSWTSLSLDGFDHDLARFKLDGAHDDVECASCHGKPARYTKLEFSDCKSCHDDAHNGRFKNACKTCHDDDAWNRIVMPRDVHPGHPLVNGHARTECRSCHDRGLLQLPSKGSDCVSCHQPVHEANFGNRCQDCHQSVKWLDLPEAIGRAAHVKTAFPLKGEHGTAACAGCHKPELPRAQRYRALEFKKCVSCHQDVHQGKLAEFGDCATCHDPLGFAPSLVEAPLHAKFGFALEGNHESTACSACHKQTGAKRTVWDNAQDECHECHENPHGSQFAVEMADGGCAHCHAPSGWGLPNIDHSFWPLTGAHASAACGGCHQPNEADKKAGKGKSYKGAPRECSGCHDDIHAGQFRTSEPMRECQSCHGTVKFALPFFDHANLTGFVLEGKHKDTECASCHRSLTLRNGDQVTHYRLGYDQCADCHADPHNVPAEVRP